MKKIISILLTVGAIITLSIAGSLQVLGSINQKTIKKVGVEYFYNELLKDEEIIQLKAEIITAIDPLSTYFDPSKMNEINIQIDECINQVIKSITKDFIDELIEPKANLTYEKEKIEALAIKVENILMDEIEDPTLVAYIKSHPEYTTSLNSLEDINFDAKDIKAINDSINKITNVYGLTIIVSVGIGIVATILIVILNRKRYAWCLFTGIISWVSSLSTLGALFIIPTIVKIASIKIVGIDAQIINMNGALLFICIIGLLFGMSCFILRERKYIPSIIKQK